MVKEDFGMDLHSFLFCFEFLCFQFKFNQICNRFCMPCILKCVILIIYYFDLLVTSFMIGLRGFSVRSTTVFQRVHLS